MTPACTPTWTYHGGFFGNRNNAKKRFKEGLANKTSHNRERVKEELLKLSRKELQNRQKAALKHYKEIQEYMVLLDMVMEESGE